MKAPSLLKRFICWGNNRGIAFIYVALILFALIGFVALAIDIGYMYLVKTELQNAADASALAGAGAIYPPPPLNSVPNPDWTAAQTNAMAFAQKNKAAGEYLAFANISTGYWNLKQDPPGIQSTAITPKGICSTSKAVCTKNSDCTGTGEVCLLQDVPAVRVKINKIKGENSGPVRTFFGRIFGIQEVSVSSNAVAVSGFVGSVPPGALFPIAVSKCLTDYYFSQSPLPSPPTTINLYSPYSPGLPSCPTGQWTSFQTGNNDTPTIRDLIFNGNNNPVDVGSPIWIEPGVKASIYDSVQEYIDTRNPIVLLPIVDSVYDSTHSYQPIRGFVSFQIDGQQKTGSPKYVYGHFVAYYKSYPGSHPGGPVSNTVTPPILVK